MCEELKGIHGTTNYSVADTGTPFGSGLNQTSNSGEEGFVSIEIDTAQIIQRSS